MPHEVARLWAFLPIGFALSVLLETPVLLVGLSPQHSMSRRLFAGVWLTACTYPIVVLVMPLLITPALGYFAYVAIAEIFAPLTECLIFWLAYSHSLPKRAVIRDMLTIIVANLASWLIGAALIDRLLAN